MSKALAGLPRRRDDRSPWRPKSPRWKLRCRTSPSRAAVSP